VLVAAALWGTVGPAQVLASSAADPGALGVARLLVGGVALAALCPVVSAWRQVLRRDVIGWVLLATAATGVYQIAFMHAVDQLGAALGTTVALGVAPVVTGLCALWWARERLTLTWVLGTVAAITGCAILLNPWAATRPNIGGIAIALVSGACYGIYTVAAKRFLSRGVPAVPATAFTLVVAGTALSPLLVLHPEHLADAGSLLLIGWIGLVGTTLAYASFVYGLHRTTAAVAGTLSLAEPLLAALLGLAVLQERLSTPALLGGGALIAGLATVTLTMPRRGRASRPAPSQICPSDGAGDPDTRVAVDGKDQ
jgi:DME family drug/metabolite transporter